MMLVVGHVAVDESVVVVVVVGCIAADCGNAVWGMRAPLWPF